MIIAPVLDIKTKFSNYLEECKLEPVVVTNNGQAVAVLLSVVDNDALERLLLAHSTQFQEIVAQGKAEIKDGLGIKHDDFWEEVLLDTLDTKES